MAMLRTLVGVAAVAILMDLAVAANYTVGAPNGGWDLMTPLQAWANSHNFSSGDSLTFVYTSNHDVLEVSKPDYDACNANNPLASYSGGMTVITLTSSGNRYFICGIPGHCDRGMKMVITTLGASAPPPPATPAVPPPAGTPSAPAPVTPSAPSPATPSGSPTATSPASSPVPSPSKTTGPVHSPVHAPKMAPSASPSKSPAISPASSPATSTNISPASSPATSTTESPAIPPFPGAASPSNTPSSASKINVLAGFTMGFGYIIMMLLIL